MDKLTALLAMNRTLVQALKKDLTDAMNKIMHRDARIAELEKQVQDLQWWTQEDQDDEWIESVTANHEHAHRDREYQEFTGSILVDKHVADAIKDNSKETTS